MNVTTLNKLLRAALLTGFAGLTLAGCGDRMAEMLGQERPVFDGYYFRSDIAFDKDAPAAFTVSVHKPELTLAGAREAGRYKANSHCIQYFGSSRIDWSIGPDSPAQALVYNAKGDLVFTGTCQAW